MDYNEFKAMLIRKVMEKAGPDADVRIHQVPKNNGMVLDGMTILKPGRNTAPTIYLDEYYSEYMNGTDPDELVRILLSVNERYEIAEALPVEDFTDFERLRDKIMYRLVNYDMNEEFLKTVPYEKIFDLAMTFYYYVENEQLENATVLLHNEDLIRWNMGAEELKTLAERNTPRNEPPVIRTLADVLTDFSVTKCGNCETGRFEYGGSGLSCTEDAFDMPVPMFVLTNRDKHYGASCMLYQSVFAELADRLDSNLIILPSSVHELIMTPDSGEFSTEELEKIVTEINATEVPLNEVLSNHIYRYDRVSRKVSM